MSQPNSEVASERDHDWRRDVTMPDDTTQTLADVLAVMRENNLQRQAAFVEWLAGSWHELWLARTCPKCYRKLSESRVSVSGVCEKHGVRSWVIGRAS